MRKTWLASNSFSFMRALKKCRPGPPLSSSLRMRRRRGVGGPLSDMWTGTEHIHALHTVNKVSWLWLQVIHSGVRCSGSSVFLFAYKLSLVSRNTQSFINASCCSVPFICFCCRSRVFLALGCLMMVTSLSIFLYYYFKKFLALICVHKCGLISYQKFFAKNQR